MNTQKITITWVKLLIAVGVLLSLISCSKAGSQRSAEESYMLENSVFNPTEKAPGVEASQQGANTVTEQSQSFNLASVSVFALPNRSSDGGFIPGSNINSGGGADAGSIPSPGSVVTSTTLPSGFIPSSPVGTDTQTSTGSVPSSGTESAGTATSGGSPAQTDSGSVVVSDGTSGPLPGTTGGSDSGNIPGAGTVDGGNDQGAIVPSEGVTQGEGVSTVTTMSPVADNGGTPSNLDSSTGSSDSGSSNGSNSGSTAGSDTGAIPSSGNNDSASDQGTLPGSGAGSSTSSDSGSGIGAGSSAGGFPNPDNGGLPNTGNTSDSGSSTGVTDDHNDTCTCHNSYHPRPCSPRKKRVTVSLGRVCSLRRSKTSDLFFEEATHPVLSIEAIVPKGRTTYSGQSSNPYSNPGVVEQWGVLSSETKLKERFLIASFDLSGVNLIGGKEKRMLEVDTTQLRKKLGRDWTKAALVASVCDDPNRDGSCYATEKRMLLSVVPAVFRANRIPSQIGLDIWSGRGYSQSQNGEVCDKQYSPVVLDLTGEGIHLSAPEDGLRFDLNDDGNPIYTGWIRGHNNAFVVRDINNNGTIDSGAELFGSATKLQNGKRAANGFEALKDLDSNGDGLLTAKDLRWRSLRLWFDRNFDGYSQKSELDRFEQYQIKSLNLNYVELLEMDEFGNQTRERSTYIRKIRGKETPLLAVDIWFRTLVDQ